MNRLPCHNNFIITLLACITIASCSKSITEETDDTYSYLFLSHTRKDDNSGMMEVAESVDYSKYDLLLLGGDLAVNTTADDAIMTRLDLILDFGRESTLWTLGNHDYTDPTLASSYTNRPTFYHYHHRGITYLVLDSQKFNSSITPDQMELLQAVVDSITHSSHLILMTHKLIWLEDEGPLTAQIDSISNGEFGTCGYCLNANNFYEEVYPKLVDIKSRGVEVICLAGDVGSRVPYFEYRTDDGIHLLASGISNKKANNKVMLLSHTPAQKLLTWDYISIESL